MLSPQENELVTRTGPGTPAGEFFRRFWLPVMLAEEVPTPDCPPVRVRVLGEDLVAFRDTQGRLGLLDAFCAHRRASLFFGRNEECGLRCVYHGWKYDVEGHCVDMPSEPPESPFKEKIKLTAYPCVERAGLIWAYLGPQAVQPELPELEWTRVPESHRYVTKVIIDCNWLQAGEGDIDSTHVQFLHRWFQGDVRRAPPVPASPLAAQVRDQLRRQVPTAVVQDTDYGLMFGWRKEVEQSYFWHITHWMLPWYALVAGGPPGSTLLCNARVPIDDEQHLCFGVVWNPERPLTSVEIADAATITFGELIPGTYLPKRNKDNDWMIDRELQRTWNFTGIKSIDDTDQVVTVSMGAVVDRSKEHLGTSDRAIIAMRRKLLTMIRALQDGVQPYPAYRGDAYRIRQVDVWLDKDVPFDEGAKEFMTVAL